MAGRFESGCKRCRKIGEKLCSRGPKCVFNERSTTPGQHGRRAGTKKLSDYGKQLREKQKVKLLYELREEQFKRFFKIASRQKGVTGETLLSLLERRLVNVVYRLKLAVSRSQARQMVVHGHVLVDGKRITAPGYLVCPNNVITLAERTLGLVAFMQTAVEKRLGMGVRVPEWLELDKNEKKGIVLRLPVKSDVTTPIEEHLIVELYSK